MRYAMVGMLVTGILSTLGCGGGPGLVPIKGKITLDGNPLNEGAIEFVPDNSKETEGAKAIGTVENGEFTLYTGAEEGVLIGHHKVAIKCPFRIDEGSSAEGDTEGEGAGQRCPIPEKYWDSETSGVTTEVTEKDQVITIEITSK